MQENQLRHFLKVQTFLIGLLLTSPIFGASKLEIVVVGAETNSGQIRVAISNTEADYSHTERAFQSLNLVVKDGSARTTIDLEPGEYAIKSYHDANNNETFDTNFIGIPQEMFGFSNNPVVRFSMPEWKEVKFTMTTKPREMTIKLQ